MVDRQDLPFKREVPPVEREAYEKQADVEGDQPTRDGMRGELRGWGIGLIVIGVA